MSTAKVPKSLARRAVEAAAWIELGCAEHALTKIAALLDTPGARPVGLKLQTTAFVELGRFDEALRTLDELRVFEDDFEWIDVTEAWCHKRSDDLSGAIACMERLIGRNRRSAIGHFNLGCYLALLGDTDRAVDEISLACGLEEGFRALLAVEQDLDSLRGDARFRALLPPG